MTRRPPFQKGDPRARSAGSKGGSVTAAQRRASTAPWQGTIIELMDAAGMVGTEWLPWRAFWKAVYALPMTPDELIIYQRHTKRDTPPSAPVEEAFMPVGRGAGKTRNAALNAVFRAISFDASRVAPGEPVVVPLIAKDRKQAKQALGYVRGFCQLEQVAPYVHRGQLVETVEFRTGVNVEIMTASFRGARGYTCPTAVCDEVAFWFDDGANPDHEILTAIRGTLGRVSGGLLLVLSSPYAPRGELHAAVESYFGRDVESQRDHVLVWNADTRSMNPTYSVRAIAREYKRDPVVAASEYGSDGHVVFRQHERSPFELAAVRAVIISKRRELAPIAGTTYYAFVDAAEGSRAGDSMTLGIAHREEGVAVLDLVREVKPPFNPGAEIATTFAPILETYGCREVVGDRHAVGFVSESFAGCGVKFIPSALTRSELYSQLLPLVNTCAVELLDHETLRQQLLALQRRAARGGNASWDHPSGGRDDVSNCAAGALVLASGVSGKKRRARFSFGDAPVAAAKKNPEEEIARMVSDANERLKRQDESDFALARRWQRQYGNGCMDGNDN